MELSKQVDLGTGERRCRYVISYVMADEALSAGARVLNMLGPAVEGMRRGATGFAGALLESPTLGHQLEFLANLFARYTEVVFPDGRSKTLAEIYKVHFRGQAGVQAEWLAIALEFNLADFLAVAKARLDDAKAAAMVSSPSKSQTPVESTG